ncbi:hypothetical protein [Pedobacter roseus]|uniref:hypothetical protein n=1 Tax=Pedobacter roseus TaxID=336820 RepID=UPI001FE41C26|nr:hypothetical protein [Pedobacter roseus]
MAKKNRTFDLPYCGIAPWNGTELLYSDRGDFSLIIKITNPALQYCGDPQPHEHFHSLMLNLIKIMGEGHIIHKQDIFSKKSYDKQHGESFLEQCYHDHFKGRSYTSIQTYLTLTRQVKNGAFYVYDEKAGTDFLSRSDKVMDLLTQGGLSPQLLSARDIRQLTQGMLAMDFSSPHISHNNLKAGDTGLEMGDREIKVLSLIDTGAIDLPSSMGTYRLVDDGHAFNGFAMDNLSFFYQVPHYHCMVYNQFIEIPSQEATLRRLRLKAKRHSGLADPANQMCASDINELLSCVARDNELLVNAHYNLLICGAKGQLSPAVNFVESSLFQQGIICSRNAYNQFELFRSALPGNGISLKSYDWYLLSCEAAICLMFRERLMESEASGFLVYFTDRQGTPVGIDPADLPITQGRIANRSKFVLGDPDQASHFL